jgi:hypothetical protein
MVYLYKPALTTVNRLHKVIFDIFGIKPTKVRLELSYIHHLYTNTKLKIFSELYPCSLLQHKTVSTFSLKTKR